MEGIQLFTTSGAGIVNFWTGGDCYPLHRHSNPKRLIPRCSALNGTNFLRESRSANGIISCGRVSMFDWGQGMLRRGVDALNCVSLHVSLCFSIAIIDNLT